jgi:hypothetical protein
VPSTATPIAPPACLAALSTPEAIPACSAGASSITAAVAAGIVNAIPKPAATSGATSTRYGVVWPALLDGGPLKVEPHGRHRYFRLAGPEVGELMEALARVSPAAPVRSLRQGTKANAVRYARTCYDHLAGMLGTGLMQAMLDGGLLAGGDGRFDPATAGHDRLSSAGFDLDYSLTVRGVDELEVFGIDLESLRSRRRPLIRYCVDWSEQRHHLAGALGAAIAERMLALKWIHRARRSRAVHITDEGYRGMRDTFGLELTPR